MRAAIRGTQRPSEATQLALRGHQRPLSWQSEAIRGHQSAVSGTLSCAIAAARAWRSVSSNGAPADAPVVVVGRRTESSIVQPSPGVRAGSGISPAREEGRRGEHLHGAGSPGGTRGRWHLACDRAPLHLGHRMRSGDQEQFDAIRSHQEQSDASRSNQERSVAIRSSPRQSGSNQTPATDSGAIRSNQEQSKAIRQQSDTCDRSSLDPKHFLRDSLLAFAFARWRPDG